MDRAWFPMMAAGVLGVLGGLAAVINPESFALAATTVAGICLLGVAVLQGWSAWRAGATRVRVLAGLIAAASLFLGLSLLFGPFGSGGLMRGLFGALLLASGAAKLWAGKGMGDVQNRPLVLGAGAVSVLLGLMLWGGFERDLGGLLGVELLASGLALLLMALQRRAGA